MCFDGHKVDLGSDVNIGLMSIALFKFVEEKVKGPWHDTNIESSDEKE